ncbi:MAG TPA: WxcM-like domain-containing protein [Saprospiraceae bacterium]|nr:WxcM-like domain-containing protein [Saprospiraceae bacterium]
MSLRDKIELLDRSLLKDERGWFLKILNGKEKNLPNHTGEIYITCAKPGQWRANHYHLVTAEWFSIIKGKAKVILEDTETKERVTISLNGDVPQTLYVPSNIAHIFINDDENEEMLLIVYSENLYDPADTITYNLI